METRALHKLSMFPTTEPYPSPTMPALLKASYKLLNIWSPSTSPDIFHNHLQEQFPLGFLVSGVPAAFSLLSTSPPPTLPLLMDTTGCLNWLCLLPSPWQTATLTIWFGCSHRQVHLEEQVWKGLGERVGKLRVLGIRKRGHGQQRPVRGHGQQRPVQGHSECRAEGGVGFREHCVPVHTALHLHHWASLTHHLHPSGAASGSSVPTKQAAGLPGLA
jgi:hypothetical protein